MTSYTFFSRSALTEKELRDIQELAKICNEHEQIDLKLNLDMLTDRPGKDADDFLCYAGDKLVGFGALFVFHQEEAEVSGMVHPEYRRQGIFRRLQAMMEEECRSRNIPQLLFIVQRGAVSGKNYMDGIRATYRFSEYWMEWTGEAEASVQPTDGVRLRSAVPEDKERLIQLDVEGFGLEEARVREMFPRLEQEPGRTTYLIETDGLPPIGKMSLSRQKDHAFIYGFTVEPAQQGKGYGRAALGKAIQLLRQEGYARIVLEVATENSKALGLYESCGFRVKSANDYYQHLL